LSIASAVCSLWIVPNKQKQIVYIYIYIYIYIYSDPSPPLKWEAHARMPKMPEARKSKGAAAFGRRPSFVFVWLGNWGILEFVAYIII